MVTPVHGVYELSRLTDLCRHRTIKIRCSQRPNICLLPGSALALSPTQCQEPHTHKKKTKHTPHNSYKYAQQIVHMLKITQ